MSAAGHGTASGEPPRAFNPDFPNVLGAIAGTCFALLRKWFELTCMKQGTTSWMVVRKQRERPSIPPLTSDIPNPLFGGSVFNESFYTRSKLCWIVPQDVLEWAAESLVLLVRRANRTNRLRPARLIRRRTCWVQHFRSRSGALSSGIPPECGYRH